MKLFNLLTGLIFFDIVITLYGVMYLGATELYPLFPYTLTFDNFFIIKLGITGIGLFGIYYLRNDKRIDLYMLPSILLYSMIGISNIWQIANHCML